MLTKEVPMKSYMPPRPDPTKTKPEWMQKEPAVSCFRVSTDDAVFEGRLSLGEPRRGKRWLSWQDGRGRWRTVRVTASRVREVLL